MARSKKAEFPMELRKDSVCVKIHRYANAGADEYRLIFRQAGKRQQIVSRDLEKLEQRAETVLDELARGVTAENSFTGAERDELAALKTIAAEINASTLVAVRHYVEAVKLLGSDLVIEAARAYVKRNMHKAADMTIEQVKNEMIAAKRARGRSERTVSDLDYRLGRFADSLKNIRIGD